MCATERKEQHHEAQRQETTQRDWHELKGGDVIRFATGWYEVFDAYPVVKDTVLVKLIMAPGQIDTHRIRVSAGSKATCRV